MRSALFGPVYRCGVFATWIDVVRRCKIIFLPTISSNFCLVPQLGPQKGAKSALRGHQPIDFRPFRTPSRGIAAFSHHGHFSPHTRPKLDTAIGKRSTRYVYAKRILSVMSDGSPVSAKERWTFWSHFHGVGGHRRRHRRWRCWHPRSTTTTEVGQNLDIWSVRKLFWSS